MSDQVVLATLPMDGDSTKQGDHQRYFNYDARGNLVPSSLGRQQGVTLWTFRGDPELIADDPRYLTDTAGDSEVRHKYVLEEWNAFCASAGFGDALQPSLRRPQLDALLARLAQILEGDGAAKLEDDDRVRLRSLKLILDNAKKFLRLHGDRAFLIYD